MSEGQKERHWDGGVSEKIITEQGEERGNEGRL